MAKRETYTRKIQCPECGRTGEAEFEENETPPHHNGRFNTKLTSVPKGFVRGEPKGSPDDPDPTIFCKHCEVEAA